jgi:hypothetical protein
MDPLGAIPLQFRDIAKNWLASIPAREATGILGLALRARLSADYGHSLDCCRGSCFDNVLDLIRYWALRGPPFKLIDNFGVKTDVIGLSSLVELPM